MSDRGNRGIRSVDNISSNIPQVRIDSNITRANSTALDNGATTIAGTTEDDGGSGMVVGVVAGIVIAVVVIALLYIHYYKRRHGRYPMFCKRLQASFSFCQSAEKPVKSSSHDDTDDKKSDDSTQQNVFSVANALKEASANFELANNQSLFPPPDSPEELSKPTKSSNAGGKIDGSFAGKTPTSAADVAIEMTEVSTRSSECSSSGRRSTLGSEIGIYQDRTLPTTLMMTAESKNQMFASEQDNLKRSMSHVSRANLLVNSEREMTENSPAALQLYNDFGPDSAIGKYRYNKLPSSGLSSKPSTSTSDYVSDVDLVNSREWKRRGKHVIDRRLPSIDSDSAIYESSTINNDDCSEINSEDYPTGKLKDFPSAIGFVNTSFIEDSLEDDRTESQQNTLKDTVRLSEIVRHIAADDDDASTLKGQESSDTESMSGSTLSKTTPIPKPRRCHSPNTTSSRAVAPQPAKRSRSSSFRSKRKTAVTEQEKSHKRAGSDQNVKHKHLKKVHSKAHAANVPEPLDLTDINVAHLGLQRSKRSTQLYDPVSYSSASLKSPVHQGTVIELPIYSQATWGGPGTEPKRTKSRMARALNQLDPRKISMRELKKPKGSKNGPRSARSAQKRPKSASRYIVDYERASLPADLNLPEEILSKIGGRAGLLVEPIEHLNIEKLTRPVSSYSTKSSRYKSDDNMIVSTDL